MSSLTQAPAKAATPAQAKKRTRSKLDAVVAPILTVLVLLSLWQIASWASPLREDLFPGPVAVAGRLPQLLADGSLVQAVGTSLFRAVSGFGIAVLIATPLALLLAHQPLLRQGVGPLVSAMQVLPSIAWVPAAIILFGLGAA